MAAPSPHTILQDLAIVLGLAALVTVVFHRLRLPVVAGYILAGIVVGPGSPGTLIGDPATIRVLAELGVVLLMFSIGLEFRLRRLIRLGGRVAVIALIELATLLSLGFGAARLLGWSTRDSIFAAALVAISSTMVISKVYAELHPDRRLRDLVFGVLVMEDLAAIVLVAVLTTIAAGGDLSGGVLWITLVRLTLVLGALLAAGMLLVPRIARLVVGLRRPETTVIASVGLSFLFALLTQAAGYSVALGAFLAGSLIAESGVSHQVSGAIKPVRDLFAAIFFVAVGMLFDGAAALRYLPAVLLLTLVVVVGKVLGVSVGAFLTGFGTHHAVRAGMSLAQIGEFSFIIAGLGAAAGAGGVPLYAIAVAIALVTAFLTPWMVRRGETLAQVVDRRLPRPLQTFATLYGSWFDLLEVQRRGGADSPWRRARRSLRFLVLDAAIIAAVLILASVLYRRLPAVLTPQLGLPLPARVAVLAGAVVVALPFGIGLLRTAWRLAAMLGDAAMPPVAAGKMDQALAPRRVLTVTLQIAIVLAVGVPLVAVTLPFLPPFGAPGVIAAVLLLLGISFWRSARDLDSHARAGGELVVHVLAKQGAAADIDSFEIVRDLLPGLGTLVPLTVEAGSEVVGKTLGEANLRGRTGATVVALVRGQKRIAFPQADERLQAGDQVAVTGSHEAIVEAAALLRGEG